VYYCSPDPKLRSKVKGNFFRVKIRKVVLGVNDFSVSNVRSQA
jgi:hypothetical protein